MSPRWIAATFCALAVCLTSIPCALAGQPARVGGPCRYDAFPGKAVILSVAPHQASASAAGASPPYPPLDVIYTFTPNAPIANEPLYRPDATHTLTLVSGMPPGPRFVAKYGIAPGRAFPCQLRIIRQGTCTPVLFAFPDIDLTDYFETTGR
jgi:hypothetical protein